MVTYDILVLLLALTLIIGLCTGVWWASYIFEEPIEKSRAKKPTETRPSGNELYTGFYICPNCKGFLSQKYKYCHKCGQALDWSECSDKS